MKRIALLGSSLACVGLLLMPCILFAQDLGLEYGAESGLQNRDVRTTAVDIINVALSFLGIIFLGLTIYAGFRWMTAGGNEDAISTAKKTLTAAVIGLVIILLAYSITNFVIGSAYEASTGYNYGQNR